MTVGARRPLVARSWRLFTPRCSVEMGPSGLTSTPMLNRLPRFCLRSIVTMLQPVWKVANLQSLSRFNVFLAARAFVVTLPPLLKGCMRRERPQAAFTEQIVFRAWHFSRHKCSAHWREPQRLTLSKPATPLKTAASLWPMVLSAHQRGLPENARRCRYDEEG